MIRKNLKRTRSFLKQALRKSLGKGGSSDIAQEATRVTESVIRPLMQMNAKGVMALVIPPHS